MLLEPPPIPPPPPPIPMGTDFCVLEPDEQWKADLRKRIEHDLHHMVEDAQIVRDTILNSQPSESSRERAQRDYEEIMDSIRTLAQDEFTRMLRQELSERTRPVDTDFTLFDPPCVSQNAEGSLSTGPQQLLEREEPASDESSEDGYGTGGLEDEDDRPDELGDSAYEEEDEAGDEGDPKTRQSRPPSRPSIPLTQTFRSKSPISGRNSPSCQPQPPNFRPTKDNNDDDVGDPYRHPPRHEAQLYSPGGAPRRQSSDSRASAWRPVPRAPESLGISRTFAEVQEDSMGPVQFTRRDSVNSTGSTGSGACLHCAGSMNSDRYRSSVAPSSYPAPTRATTSARSSFDEGVRSPMSASPSRTIYGLQRTGSQTTPEEGPRWTSRASLNLHRSFGDLNQTTEGPRGGSRGSLNLRHSFGDLSQTTREKGPRRTSWGSLNSHRSFSDLAAPDEGPRRTSRGSVSLRRSFGELNQTTPDGSRGTARGSLISPRSFSELNRTTPEEGPQGTSWGALDSRRSFGDSGQTTQEEGTRRTSRSSLNLRRSFGDLSQTSPEEGPWGTSRGSLDSRRSLTDLSVQRRHHSNSDPRLPSANGDLSDISDDFVRHLDDRRTPRSMRSVRSAVSIEQLTAWLENEARRKEEEATRKEEQASRKEEEARRLEEKARQSLEEAKRLESGAQQAEASVKIREAAARNKAAKVKRKETEVKKREADAQKREAEAQRREESIRYRELEARLKEELARRKEEAAQRKEDDVRKREEDVRRKEEGATRKEEEASRKEEEARRLEEKARQSLKEAKRLEAGARQVDDFAETREAPLENEEAEAKRDEIEVNFFAVGSNISKC